MPCRVWVGPSRAGAGSVADDADRGRRPLGANRRGDGVASDASPGRRFASCTRPAARRLDYHDIALRRQVLGKLEQLARRERAIFIKIDPEIARSWGLEAERPSPLGFWLLCATCATEVGSHPLSRFSFAIPLNCH